MTRVNVLIVPRANPNAAERFGRESASGVDINRLLAMEAGQLRRVVQLPPAWATTHGIP